jgi:hypothetical protein
MQLSDAEALLAVYGDLETMQGLGFEAASATIAAGFEQLDLSAIAAETRPENLPRTSTTDQTGHATRRNEHPRLAGLPDHT